MTSITRPHIVCADMMASVFDELLKRGSSDAWVATIRMEYNDYARPEELPSVGGFLTIACYAPTNYVTVMAAFSQRPPYISRSAQGSDLAQIDWQPITRHDSAWRDDGVRCTIMSVHKQIARAAEGVFAKAAKDLSFHIHLEHLDKVPALKALEKGLAKSKSHGQLMIDLSIEQGV